MLMSRTSAGWEPLSTVTSLSIRPDPETKLYERMRLFSDAASEWEDKTAC